MQLHEIKGASAGSMRSLCSLTRSRPSLIYLFTDFLIVISLLSLSFLVCSKQCISELNISWATTTTTVAFHSPFFLIIFVKSIFVTQTKQHTDAWFNTQCTNKSNIIFSYFLLFAEPNITKFPAKNHILRKKVAHNPNNELGFKLKKKRATKDDLAEDDWKGIHFQFSKCQILPSIFSSLNQCL